MGIKIIEDKGQQFTKHETKHQWFCDNDIELIQAPLPVGDYIFVTEEVLEVIKRKKSREIDVRKMDFLGTYKVTVDTKKDLQEIIGNVCGRQHARFRDECILAQNNGIKLFVLIENKNNISCANDLLLWDNPRLHIKKRITLPSGEYRKVLKYPTATKGETLYKALKTMEQKYGVTFCFCDPRDTGKAIVELLKTGSDSKATYQI